MTLYNTMASLEEASIVLYEELADIALHNGAIARTIISTRLERLSLASSKFIDQIRQVNNILNIYNDELAVTIRGATDGKRDAWHKLDLWLDTFPTNVDKAGRATTIVTSPKISPTHRYVLSLGVQLDFPYSPTR